ncbi:amidohydrolase family protein [Nocardia sp. NPDC052316]|uniref:amidohydrolase family protein n=1 Tax=Nocardia sp. NPDC052316 TaxID=3364329 RepID=UPI0037C6997E
MVLPDMDRAEFLSWLVKGAAGAVAGGLLAQSAVGADPGAAEPITVLSGATVIDGTGSPPRPDMTIVLAADRILAVGRYPDLPRLPAVRTLDLTGKFVIPGLWDMHTHMAQAESTFPPLHVVHGVTGIREMWGFPEIHDLRRRIEQGAVLGPRIVLASSIIDGPPGIWPGSTVVSNEAEARAAVRRSKHEGADFVKVYSLLTHETFTAIADESRRVGLPFAGHVPHRIPVAEAVELGQHTIEHLYGMLLSTSSRTSELYAEINAGPMDPEAQRVGRARMERAAADTHSPEVAAALFDLMIRRGTWQSPTLVVLERLATGVAPGRPDDDRLRYLPDFLRQFWQQRIGPEPDAAQATTLRRNFDSRLELLGAMNAAGVGIVAGTDAGNPFVFPGFSLHEELELLVRAGLSPMQALQAATRDAARCAGLAAVSGTVEVGKNADLVVLDSDPLAAIGNTRRIHAVVCRGRYLDPADRERILREVEAAAQVEYPALPTGGLAFDCCG